jgi:hypothetical protein
VKRDDLAVGDLVKLVTYNAVDPAAAREHFGVVAASDQRGVTVTWEDGMVGVLRYDGSSLADAHRLEKV